MPSTIGTINVQLFDPPPTLQQKGSQHYRVPGVSGSGAVVDSAVSGTPFTANTTAYVASADVETVRLSYAALIGTLVTLVYEGVNFSTAHNTQFLVLDVQISEARRIPRAVGIGFDHNPAGQIRASWTLVPVPV